MRHGVRGFCALEAPRAAARSLAFALALLLPAAATHASEAKNWQEAEHALAAGGSFDRLSPRADPPSGPWTRVPLPHVIPRTLVPDASSQQIDTAWYRLRLDDAPSVAPGQLRLYLPRWQTIGFIAVYADGRLIHRSEAGPVWNGYNHPLWLNLDPAGERRPAELLIRVDHLRGAGVAVSRVWTGEERALDGRHRVREWLQAQFPAGASIGFLMIGSLALVAWWLRREALYGLFFASTVLSYLRCLHYHVGTRPLPIPEAWFTWLTLASLAWLLGVSYLMSVHLHNVRQRWVERPMLAAIAIFTVVTLPILADAPGIALLTPITYLVLLLSLVGLSVLGIWSAWRARSRDGLLVASAIALSIPAGTHDWLLQNYRLNPESLYLLPYTVVAVSAVFLFVVLRRYLDALRESEQANSRLEQRLSEREAALAATHERLRTIERERVLAQERERLMQDMHDGLGSSLMSALKAVEHGGEADIAQVLRECIEDLKLAIDSLEPVQSDLLLLLATLRFRLGTRLEHSGIRMEWAVQDVPPLTWLDAQAALHILRILQEVLGNAARHSGTDVVSVATEAQGDTVLVTISDRGRGFEPQVARAGRGLVHVRRRAAEIGAEVVWRSSEAGTTFELRLPRVREGAAPHALQVQPA